MPWTSMLVTFGTPTWDELGLYKIQIHCLAHLLYMLVELSWYIIIPIDHSNYLFFPMFSMGLPISHHWRLPLLHFENQLWQPLSHIQLRWSISRFKSYLYMINSDDQFWAPISVSNNKHYWQKSTSMTNFAIQILGYANKLLLPTPRTPSSNQLLPLTATYNYKLWWKLNHLQLWAPTPLR